MADLSFGGTDIHDRTGIFFDIVSGFRGVAEVRGTDSIIPGKPGRTARSRVKDRRLIRLHGSIRGDGATLTARQQDFKTNCDTAASLFDTDDAAKSLAVVAPYMGLASGTATISARVLNVIEGREVSGIFQEWDVVLEAIGDPPDWA